MKREKDYSVNERLRQLMKWHCLTRSDVCRMLGLKMPPGRYSHGTLDGWLSRRRQMKERDLMSIIRCLHAQAILETVKDEADLPDPEARR